MPIHNGCPSGEFWIDKSGKSIFSNTDLGECHDIIATNLMIDFDDLIYTLNNEYGYDLNKSDRDNIYEVLIGVAGNDEDIKIFRRVLANKIGERKAEDITECDSIWTFITHEDAIRVNSGEFAVKKINADTIKRIKDFLEEEYNHTELSPNCNIHIEEVSPFAPKPGSPYNETLHVDISFKVLMESVESTKDMFALGKVSKY